MFFGTCWGCQVKWEDSEIEQGEARPQDELDVKQSRLSDFID